MPTEQKPFYPDDITTGAMYKKTTARLFEIYRYLPVGKHKAKTLTELLRILGTDEQDIKLNKRNALKQDLKIMAQSLGRNSVMRIPPWEQDNIELTISGKTPKFYLHEQFSLQSKDAETVFFMEMLERFTRHYIPETMQDKLSLQSHLPHKKQQTQYENTALGQWKHKLTSLPSVLAPPDIASDVLTVVHQALLQNKQVNFSYRKKHHEQTEQKTLYPIGLVFMENMMYLTGYYDVGEGISAEKRLLDNHRNFAINRILEITMMDKNIPEMYLQDAYNLSSLQELGKLEPHNQGSLTIILILKIKDFACEHILERPLSVNQKITKLADNWLQLTAEVENTQRLKNWLISMAPFSVVLQPAFLREDIYNRLQSALSNYE